MVDLEELKSINEELIYLGDKPEQYADAIIGITYDGNHVIYSVEKFQECLVKEGMTYEEAAKAAIHFALRHPNDERPINAYKCSVCGKWHIGHSSLEHKANQPNLVTISYNTSFRNTRLGLIASL